MKTFKFAFQFLFRMVLVAMFVSSSYAAQPSSIVDVSWLQQNIGDPNVRVIDLREKEAFNKEHLAGSVNIYFMELFDQNLKIPPLDKIREMFSQAGIDQTIRVVAIDDGSFIWSARLLWLLETLGHKKVNLLNVGYGNWQGNPLPITQEITYPPKRNFITSLDNNLLQTKLGTLMAIGKNPILDGRAYPHYMGLASTTKRYGHIPTAENSPCTKNIKQTETGNQLHELKDVASLYQHLPKDKQIILYCDGGAESALNYVVMKELGYKVAVYDGSWEEWSADMALPVSNPNASK